MKVIGNWIWGRDTEEPSQLEWSVLVEAVVTNRGQEVGRRSPSPMLDKGVEQISFMALCAEPELYTCSIICHELNSTCVVGDRDRCSEPWGGTDE